MADKRTFEGKNLDEVLAAASNALGIEEPDLDYEILQQGRQGLLGIGAKNVCIRVMPPLTPVSNELISGAAIMGKPDDQLQNPARDEARARRGSRRRKSGGGGGGGGGRGGQRGRQGQQGRQEGQQGQQDQQGERSREAEGDGSAAPDRSRRRRGRRGGRRRSEGRREENREPRPTPAPEVAESIRETMHEMLGLCDFQLEVQASSVEGGVQLVLDGDDRTLAAKKNAELCAAFQFVLNRMARRRWPESGRIRVGVEGQESMRDEELITLTRETADAVQESGKSRRLKPMNAYERRLVHLTIREMEGVHSRSEGRGYLKRVVVFTEND